MSIFLSFVFIFFIGSMLGWIIELFYKRIVLGKWVNSGFLIGPYLPIYGFGLCIITWLHITLSNYNLNVILNAILIAIVLTVLEYISGLIFIKYGKIKLWDYSDEWLNYQGIICPLYSLFWAACAIFYNYFLADHIINALIWFSENLSFSFILGIFIGTLIIDFISSAKVFTKIRRFAKENKIEVIYEEFKTHIQDLQKQAREKYSFLFSFKQSKPLKEYLNDYKENKRK